MDEEVRICYICDMNPAMADGLVCGRCFKAHLEYEDETKPEINIPSKELIQEPVEEESETKQEMTKTDRIWPPKLPVEPFPEEKTPEVTVDDAVLADLDPDFAVDID